MRLSQFENRVPRGSSNSISPYGIQMDDTREETIPEPDDQYSNTVLIHILDKNYISWEEKTHTNVNNYQSLVNIVYL